MPILDLAGPVDWDVVDEELALVPKEFRDPRFDSLRHVLNILGPVDSGLRLEEVRLRQEVGQPCCGGRPVLLCSVYTS